MSRSHRTCIGRTSRLLLRIGGSERRRMIPPPDHQFFVVIPAVGEGAAFLTPAGSGVPILGVNS